jgi:hypothetical protein
LLFQIYILDDEEEDISNPEAPEDWEAIDFNLTRSDSSSSLSSFLDSDCEEDR